MPEPPMQMHAERGWHLEHCLFVKRLWIILLASLIWAFNKFEGKKVKEIDFFPFSDWTMTRSDYIFSICLSIVPACFVWALVTQETERRKEVKMAAWITSFKLPWFLLTCNMTFFRIRLGSIGVIPIGYDALMFVLLGLVVLKATIYEQ